MKMRTAATLSVAALATGTTLVAAPGATARPVVAEGEGWMPPGQICQQARTVSEDGSPSTIAGLTGIRCGQFLGKAALPEEEAETPTEEPVVEEPTTEEPVSEEPTDDEATLTEDEQVSLQSTESADGDDGWSGSHQARSHQGHNGQSHWAQKGNRHPHHPGNANGNR